MSAFASALGGGQELKAAMERRGIDTGILNQITPSAPTAPDALPPQTLPQTPNQGLPAQAPASLPTNSGEAQILVKALDSRLKTLSKLDEAQIPATSGQ